MSDPHSSEASGRFEVRATATDHFAWLRTRLAVERTMLAYMRTAVSLIGFGFAMFQIVFKIQQSPEITDVRFPNAAWYFGLALIFCGVLAAVFSAMQYRWTLRYLWSGSYAAIAGMTTERKQTPLYAVTFVIVVIGVFAFFAVLLRLV
jgi:putative membrane protein